VAWAACVGAAFVAFLPVLHAYYLHTDDYFWSPYGGFTPYQILNFMMIVGRPLGGVFYLMFSRWPGDMDSMNVLRALSVLNIGCFAYIVVRWLRVWRVGAGVALAISVVLITQPPFQAYAAYLATAPYGLAFTLAAVATLLIHRAMSEDGRQISWRRLLLPALLLLASVSLYQPAPFLVCSLLVVPLLQTEPAVLWRSMWRPIIVYAGVLVVAVGTYYGAWRLWAAFTNPPSAGTYDLRGVVPLSGIRLRLNWYRTGVWFQVLNFWNLSPSLAVQWVAYAVAATVALLDFTRRAPWQWLLKYFTIALLGIFCFLPSLASSTPQLQYRTYAAVSAYWVLLILVGATRAASRLDRRSVRWLTPALGALALLGIFWANSTVNDYFALPDTTEFLFVRHALRMYTVVNPTVPLKYVEVIPSGEPVTVNYQRDEFGQESVDWGPNIRPVIDAALDELGMSTHVAVLVDQGGQWIEWSRSLAGVGLATTVVPAPPSKGTAVVNMYDLVLY
jgi:hypothetical protein